MADDKLRIVATVEDQFTGPLGKLGKELKGVGDQTSKQAVNWKKDWSAVRDEASKFQGVLKGFDPIFAAVGVTGFGAAMSITGMVSALRGFAGSTQQLSMLSRETGVAVDKLRAFGALGERFGVSADAMKGSVASFATTMFDLRRRWGEAYSSLQAMNLGKLAEDLVNAPNMDEALKRAVDGIQAIPEPEVRRRVSRMLFGTDDIARIAGSMTGKFSEAIAQVQKEVGHLDKKTEEAAARFEQSMGRIGAAAERLKLKVLSPMVEGLAESLEDFEKNGLAGDERMQETRKLLSPFGGPEATPQEKLEGRRTQVESQLRLLEAGPRGADYQRKHDRMVEELKRVADELQKVREGGGASVSPSSFGGSSGGGGSLIQKAAWGGGGIGGILGGGSGFGGSGGGGARDVPSAPPIGNGSGGRSFGGTGPLGGSGTGSSAGNLTALIDEAAKAAGIDPRIMQGIRAGESHRRSSYDVKSDRMEDSYGPFQLNRRGGLGAQFERETGLDLHDPRTIAEQARWVARHIAKRLRANPNYNPGSEWFGYRGRREADPRWGDSGYVPSGDGPVAGGDGPLTRSGQDVPATDGTGGVDQRQGGIRRQAITDALRDQIAAAAKDAGVNAEIYSGGQDGHGPHRTGSHRHDGGRSADLKLYTLDQNGRRRYLSMNDPADRKLMEGFIRGTVRHGATGVGAGPGYMGEHGIHIGGGEPSAWGAGGRSANAPDWVRRAHRDGMSDRAAVPRRAREAGDGTGQAKPPAAGSERAELEAYRAEREKRARAGELPGEDEDDAAGFARWKAERAKGAPTSGRPEDRPVQHEPTARERVRAEFDRRAAKAGPRAVDGLPAAGAQGGKGTLHIRFDNAPAGMTHRADTDGLFRETTVSKGRSQMDMDRA